MTAVMLRLWVLGGVVLLAACRPQHDDPVEAYAVFSSNLKHRDIDAAYKALSTPTQKAYEARVKLLAEAACPPGAQPSDKDREKEDDGAKDKPRCAVKAEAPLVAFASGVKVQPLGPMKLLERSGDVAVIEIGEDGGSYRQRMVKEGAAWRVDLTEALR